MLARSADKLSFDVNSVTGLVVTHLWVFMLCKTSLQYRGSLISDWNEILWFRLQVVELTFVRFSTEGCCDYVTLYDGYNNTASQIRQLSGSVDLSPIYSTQEYLFIRFHSDSSVASSGFNATYQSVSPPPPSSSSSSSTTYSFSTTTGNELTLVHVHVVCIVQNAVVWWLAHRTIRINPGMVMLQPQRKTLFRWRSSQHGSQRQISSHCLQNLSHTDVHFSIIRVRDWFSDEICLGTEFIELHTKRKCPFKKQPTRTNKRYE